MGGAENFYQEVLSCHPDPTQEEKELESNRRASVDNVISLASSACRALEERCMSTETLEEVLRALENELDGAKIEDQATLNGVVLSGVMGVGSVEDAMLRLSPSMSYRECELGGVDFESSDFNGAENTMSTGIFYSTGTMGTVTPSSANNSRVNRSGNQFGFVDGVEAVENGRVDPSNTGVFCGADTRSIASTAIFSSVDSSRGERSGNQFGAVNRGGLLAGSAEDSCFGALSTEAFCCVGNPFMGMGGMSIGAFSHSGNSHDEGVGSQSGVVDTGICLGGSWVRRGCNKDSDVSGINGQETLPDLNNCCGGARSVRSSALSAKPARTSRCASIVLPNIKR